MWSFSDPGLETADFPLLFLQPILYLSLFYEFNKTGVEPKIRREKSEAEPKFNNFDSETLNLTSKIVEYFFES